MIERFQFHAFASGIAGHIFLPFDEIIPVQASAALPETGGFASTRVDNFRFRDILSFDAAWTVVTGSFSGQDNAFDTIATTTIEGLNLLGMVTADRVVARISSEHPNELHEEPFITPVGSYFQNLRIAGHKVSVNLATGTFARFGTARDVRSAYRENKDGFREQFNRLSLAGVGDAVPAPLRKHFPWRTWESEEIPETNGIISCSLVDEIGGLSSGLRPCGHVIHVRGFGTIRLAEFKITSTSREITMLQVDLGSTPKGKVTGGSASGNGSGY